MGQRVADTQSSLTSQRASLRELLAEQGLTVGPAADSLPAMETLQCFAATQLAGVEAELCGLGACSREGSLGAGSSPSRVAPVQPQGAAGPLSMALAAEANAPDSARCESAGCTPACECTTCVPNALLYPYAADAPPRAHFHVRGSVGVSALPSSCQLGCVSVTVIACLGKWPVSEVACASSPGPAGALSCCTPAKPDCRTWGRSSSGWLNWR
jgi:hypothetical protein